MPILSSRGWAFCSSWRNMNEDLLVKRVQSGVARLTLNRPQARNAVNTPLMEAICEAMDEMGSREDMKALIVAGAGSAFCAGRDLKESTSHTRAQAARFMVLGERWSAALREFPVPTIAAVNGPALGWGMVLMLECDLRIGANNAVLGYPETTLGVFPGADATVRLTRQTFVPSAKDLALTGRRLDAREGLRLGLLNRVVPKGDLMAEVDALGAEIAQRPLERLRAMKASFLKVEAMSRFGHLSLAERMER